MMCGSRIGSLARLALLAGVCGTALLPGQQHVEFEHLFTIGSGQGLNPKQRFRGKYSRLIFGDPKRESAVVRPTDVAVDPDERIWITDPGAGGVHMFDVLGGEYKFIKKVAGETKLACPDGIDSDIHGRMYIVDSCAAQVYIFDREGSFLRELFTKDLPSGLERPSSITVSRDLHSIYITDPPRHKVVVFNQEGESVRELGNEEELQSPQTVAVAADRIYVYDRAAYRVQVYSPGGELLETLRWPKARRLSAFAADEELGRLFVGGAAFGLILVYDQEGREIAVFGQTGVGTDQYRRVYRMYVDADHRVYVVDDLGGKVLVYREVQPGKLIPPFAPGADKP